MADQTNRYIHRKKIADLLYDDDKFIREFAEATETSFREFSGHYRKFLLNRDEDNFRRAGHKIKPVIQMLEIPDILEEYEQAKEMLWNQKKDEKLEQSADKIDRICEQIIFELEQMQ
jgi:hypothetical protein